MEHILDTIFDLDMNEVEGFEFPHDKPFGLRIIIDGVKYEFYIHLKSTSDKLICMGSGARDPDFDRSRPFSIDGPGVMR